MGRIGSGVRVNTRLKKFLPGAVLRSKKEGYVRPKGLALTFNRPRV